MSCSAPIAERGAGKSTGQTKAAARPTRCMNTTNGDEAAVPGAYRVQGGVEAAACGVSSGPVPASGISSSPPLERLTASALTQATAAQCTAFIPDMIKLHDDEEDELPAEPLAMPAPVPAAATLPPLPDTVATTKQHATTQLTSSYMQEDAADQSTAQQGRPGYTPATADHGQPMSSTFDTVFKPVIDSHTLATQDDEGHKSLMASCLSTPLQSCHPTALSTEGLRVGEVPTTGPPAQYNPLQRSHTSFNATSQQHPESGSGLHQVVLDGNMRLQDVHSSQAAAINPGGSSGSRPKHAANSYNTAAAPTTPAHISSSSAVETQTDVPEWAAQVDDPLAVAGFLDMLKGFFRRALGGHTVGTAGESGEPLCSACPELKRQLDNTQKELGAARMSMHSMASEAGTADKAHNKLAFELKAASIQVAQLNQQFECSRSEEHKLRQYLQQAECEAASLQQRVNAFDTELSCVKGELDKARTRCKELEDEVSLLEERFSSEQAALDSTKHELRVAQELVSTLQSKLQRQQDPAKPDPEPVPSASAAAGGGSFEIGFSNEAQQSLLDCLSLKLETFVNALAKYSPEALRQHLPGVDAIISCIKQRISSFADAHAVMNSMSHSTEAVHSHLLHTLMTAVYGACWPDIQTLTQLVAGLQGAADAAAQRQMAARLFRSWYLTADVVEAQLDDLPQRAHGATADDPHKQAHVRQVMNQLSCILTQDLQLSNETRLQNEVLLQRLSVTAIKVRCLVGYLLGARPGLQLLCASCGEAWDDAYFDAPQREVVSAPSGSGRRALFCTRPGLAVFGDGGEVIEVLVRQQAVALVPVQSGAPPAAEPCS